MTPEIATLHDQAMEHAVRAEVAKSRGELGNAKMLFFQAMEYEKHAALLTPNDAILTRTVLVRSAASLALDCGELQESLRLIKTGLRVNAPEELRQELIDLRKSVLKRQRRTPGVKPRVFRRRSATFVTTRPCPVYQMAGDPALLSRRNRGRRYIQTRNRGMQKVASIPEGTEVTILEWVTRSSMVHVRTLHAEGWVFARFLKIRPHLRSGEQTESDAWMVESHSAAVRS